MRPWQSATIATLAAMAAGVVTFNVFVVHTTMRDAGKHEESYAVYFKQIVNFLQLTSLTSAGLRFSSVFLAPKLLHTSFPRAALSSLMCTYFTSHKMKKKLPKAFCAAS